jgi:hypothetical protein
MSYNWRIGQLRSRNMIEAHPQRLTSADGTRWALGRNVKGETAVAGTFVGVEVWTLKQRVNGKAVTVDTYRDRAAAERWVAGK